MPIVVDIGETNPALSSSADHVAPLRVEGTGYRYDLRVDCADGTVYRLERKAFADFAFSWRQGRLERQLSYVDGLVLELGGFEPADGLHRQALKHLVSVSANIWVIVSLDPTTTMSLLRYVETRGGRLHVRPNVVWYRAPTVRASLLAALPRINPLRVVGAAIEAIVDWERLVEALHLERWLELPGIGRGTVERIRRELLGTPEP